MNELKNEHGAALVLTLFIVTLLLLFVLTLFYQVNNATKQVTTMEKNIDARNLADMGTAYIYCVLDLYNNQYMEEELKTIFEKEFVGSKKVEIDPSNRWYQIKVDLQNYPTSINYTTKGVSFGKVVEMEDVIIINNEAE